MALFSDNSSQKLPQNVRCQPDARPVRRDGAERHRPREGGVRVLESQGVHADVAEPHDGVRCRHAVEVRGLVPEIAVVG